MKVRLLYCLSICHLVVACQLNPAETPFADAPKKNREWQASTLKPETVAKANAAIKRYERCLNDETVSRAAEKKDFRAIGDQVLQICEPVLACVKSAYRTENVPDVVSERYMRQTRSRGAQSLMRFLEAAQAQRVSQEPSSSHP